MSDMAVISPCPISPFPGYVIVTPKKEESPIQGLTLPENQQQRDQIGVVVAVGDSIKSEHDGSVLLISPAKVGDTVIHTPLYTEAYTHYANSMRYRVVHFRDLKGKFNE